MKNITISSFENEYHNEMEENDLEKQSKYWTLWQVILKRSFNLTLSISIKFWIALRLEWK